jgi:hypothetical protein
MAKRSKKHSRPVEEPSPLLERLKEIACQSGLEVREERLLREVGYSVRSGVCRVSDQEVLLLDKNASPAERIEAVCGVLAGRDLDAVFIEPDLRRAIGGNALLAQDDEGPAAPAA